MVERKDNIYNSPRGPLKHDHMDMKEHVLEGKETWEKLMDS